MTEHVKLDNIHNTEWPVRQRIGEWALVKRHDDYAIYHATKGTPPRMVPTTAVDKHQVGMINPRLSYALGRKALKSIAARFPTFVQDEEHVRELREYLESDEFSLALAAESSARISKS